MLLAVPDLTEPQLQQLAMARDGAVTWDEPALYPLLTNVLSWTDDDRTGALTADYDALHRNPAEYRGRLLLIEGQLGGPPQQVKQRLARPGPWENNLQQWSILISRNPDEVAIVLLADPMPLDQLPKRGGPRVEIMARFFKLWQFVDRQGQPTNYLVFVGKHVNVQSGGTSQLSQPTTGAGGRWIAMAVFVMGLGWMLLRRAVRPKPKTKRHRRIAPSAPPDTPSEVTPPQDPADALAELDHDTTDPND